MKEKIRENNQQQDTLKSKTGWKRHFTGKNIIINGLIALIPASLIIAILKELGLGGALIIGSIMFGLIYLIGEIRERISRFIRSIKKKNNL